MSAGMSTATGADRITPPAMILRGQVMHQRLRPVAHRFVYPVFCVRVDLARAAQAGNAWFGVDRRRVMSIRSRDYGARDGACLHGWVRAQLAAAGVAADGAIWLQTFPRLFGFVFNPISFFFCHDAQGALRAVLCEVNNTFGQRHHYLLSAPDGAAIDEHTGLSCSKRLHVSPFCEVSGYYRFRFRESGGSAMAGIDYYDDAASAHLPQQEPLMRTAIGGRLRPMSAGAALAALCAQPLLTFGVVARIHWQALLLWRKRAPWFGKSPRSSHASPSSEKEMPP